MITTLPWGEANFVSPGSCSVQWLLVSGEVAEGVIVIQVIMAHKMKHQRWCSLLF